MPTERDELRLTVTLVDNVSAGLNKIKGEFRDLTEGSGQGHAEKFKKENAEAVAVLKRMGGEAGEVYKAFGMMRLGALGAGGVALLGFEIAKQIKEWGQLADKIRGTSQVGRLFGIKPPKTCATSRSSWKRSACGPSRRWARSPSSWIAWARCSATRRCAQTSCAA